MTLDAAAQAVAFLRYLFFHSQGGVSVGGILICLGASIAFAGIFASYDEKVVPGLWEDEPSRIDLEKMDRWYGRRLP